MELAILHCLIILVVIEFIRLIFAVSSKIKAHKTKEFKRSKKIL